MLSNCLLDEIQVMLIYSRASLVTVMSASAIDKGLSVKPGLGHLGHW